MYFLYAFGRLLERRLSTGLTLSLFASSAVAGSLAFWAVHIGQDAALGGASGAVSGILGCYFALFPGRMVGISLFSSCSRSQPRSTSVGGSSFSS